jgi:hypothetical protein
LPDIGWRRKGIWVGGPVPLGYAAMDKRAIVVPAEAKTVGAIFTRYLELGSVVDVQCLDCELEHCHAIVTS